MRTTRLHAFATFLSAAAVGLSAACSDSSGPSSPTHFGPVVSFGQGSARSFVEVDGAGNATSVGMTVSESALSGLPQTSPGPSPTALMATVPLPTDVTPFGFDHLEIGWNPHGHEPPQLYGLPHFDMHFYMVTAAVQNAILPNDPQYGAKANHFPDAPYIPARYVPPPGDAAASAIPQMGVHWTSLDAPELNGQGFSSTLIYGSWDGAFIFIEPMITKAYLDTHPNATTPIAQPTSWAKPGRYPTSYSVTYDQAAKEFKIVLGGLTARQ